MELQLETVQRYAAAGEGTLRYFKEEVCQGLRSTPKRLPSKYLYDQRGDRLFQQIMSLPEYYLTACELDVFQNHTDELMDLIPVGDGPFDLIELGAGDALKSTYLLKHLVDCGADFTYMPIDISTHILAHLKGRLEVDIPELGVTPLHGEYLEMLDQATAQSQHRKVLLFLGSNIGNMELEEAITFCTALSDRLCPGDIVLMGFDLKKHPRTIRDAYDDASGITALFNLNLLQRINRELGAHFQVDAFEHYQSYDPLSGACRSYLISLQNQVVRIDDQCFVFAKDEPMEVEISQKFSIEDISLLAHSAGFSVIGDIMDSKKWFVDSCWEKD